MMFMMFNSDKAYDGQLCDVPCTDLKYELQTTQMRVCKCCPKQEGRGSGVQGKAGASLRHSDGVHSHFWQPACTLERGPS